MEMPKANVPTLVALLLALGVYVLAQKHLPALLDKAQAALPAGSDQ